MDNLPRVKYEVNGIGNYIVDNASALFIGAVLGIVFSLITVAPVASYNTRMAYADRECAIQSLSKGNIYVVWDHNSNKGLVRKYGLNEGNKEIWVTHDELMKMAREHEITNTVNITIN